MSEEGGDQAPIPCEPRTWLTSHDPGQPGVEFAKKNEFALLWHRRNGLVNTLIHTLLNFNRICHGWGMSTYKTGILFAFREGTLGDHQVPECVTALKHLTTYAVEAM